MRRVVFPLFVAMCLAAFTFASAAGAEGDSRTSGVAQDTVAGESATTKKNGATPTDGAVNSAPVKSRPVSKPQVRFAGFDLGRERVG